MAKLFRIARVGALLSVGLLFGCDQSSEAQVKVEKLPEVEPNLPAVPKLPPPPHPTQYEDETYSIYGLRRHLDKTIDTDVTVTGYIVKIYEPPECPKDEDCPTPAAPHLWMADTKTETDESKWLLVAGYAENQKQIDEAIADAKRGKTQEIPEDSGLLPIPTDFGVGAKVKMTGRFSFISGSGFQSSEGVLGYGGHETIEPAPELAQNEQK